jgi:outer membrane protein TolC
MLPTIDVTGGVTFSNVNIRQELSSGGGTVKNGVRNDNYVGAVALNWVLFDGLGMFATYGRLTELKEQGEINTRIQIENTISSVINSYFDVVRNQQILRSVKESISVTEERVKIADKKLQVGSGSKTELLQAKIDLNMLYSQLFTQQILLYDSKTTLNQLMVRPVDTEFDVQDSIPLGQMLDLAGIRKDALEHNNALQFEERNIQIQKFLRREVNAQRFPIISLNTSYNFSRQQSQAGLFLFNQNYGFNGGFSVAWRVFDSWRVNTQYRVATLNYQSSKLIYEDVKQQTDGAVLRSYKRYELALQQVDIEKESVDMSHENVTLSLERFKQGLSNSLELREAQQSYIEAVSRWMNALYSAKTQEVELLRLKGALVN